MTHGSVFSGIGAPEIAADMLGWQNLFHCEINPFGRTVLDYYYPNSKSYEDITKTDFSEWQGRIDVLTGGFPCQPFSLAGKRRGSSDERFLWPYMLRTIQQVQPTWFIGENVGGIRSVVFPSDAVRVESHSTLFGSSDTMERRQRYVIEEICRQIEGAGYSVQPLLIPACAVGAPHRRDRIFFVGRRNDIPYSEDTLRGGQLYGELQKQGNQWNVGNAGAGDNQRICKKKGIEVSDTRQTDRLSSSDTHRHNDGRGGSCQTAIQNRKEGLEKWHEIQFTKQPADVRSEVQDTAAYTDGQRFAAQFGNDRPERQTLDKQRESQPFTESGRFMLPENRWRAFPSVAAIHRGNDGIPFDVDCLTIPFSKWRQEALKAYGNAIVVQVMYELFRSIELIERQ